MRAQGGSRESGSIVALGLAALLVLPGCASRVPQHDPDPVGEPGTSAWAVSSAGPGAREWSRDAYVFRTFATESGGAGQLLGDGVAPEWSVSFYGPSKNKWRLYVVGPSDVSAVGDPQSWEGDEFPDVSAPRFSSPQAAALAMDDPEFRGLVESAGASVNLGLASEVAGDAWWTGWQFHAIVGERSMTLKITDATGDVHERRPPS